MGKEIEVVAALIRQGDRLLICQRPPQKARGLQWELVGGKVEPGETGEQALCRECREELDIGLSVGPELLAVTHEYPDITVHLRVFAASIAQGEPRLLEHVDMAWILPGEAERYDLCPADRVILEKIGEEGIYDSGIDT